MFYTADFEKQAEQNANFRKVLFTGQNSQIVAMSIPPGGEIGEEVHQNTDQILFIIEGDAKAVIDSETRFIKDEEMVFIPAGTRHNFINKGSKDLKLITVYSPPEHPDGTVQATRGET